LPLTDAGDVVHPVTGDVQVSVKNECCEEMSKLVPLGTPEFSFDLQQLPAKVIATCDQPGDVTVQINGTPWKLDQPFAWTFDRNSTQTSKQFEVSFSGDHVSPTLIVVQVRANDTQKVPCAPRVPNK
jgi:hypothetical protein